MDRSTATRSASAALGTATVLLGLRGEGRNKGLCIAVGTGLLAYAAFGKWPPQLTKKGSLGPKSVSRVITIGKPRAELYRKWCDPQVLSDIFGDALPISAEGDGRIRVHRSLPGHRKLTWTSRLIKAGDGSNLLWRTDPGAAIPHEMFLRLHDARPAEWGTEVTLGISTFPDDKLTTKLVQLTDAVTEAMLMKVLRRFKSLVETGEMPTLSRTPAARKRASEAH